MKAPTKVRFNTTMRFRGFLVFSMIALLYLFSPTNAAKLLDQHLLSKGVNQGK